MIKRNAHKYSISAMCKCLEIARSTYYYEAQEIKDETELENRIEQIFHDNKEAYGSRRIKVELFKQGEVVSRRKIRRIMIKKGLVSKYTVACFKPHTKKCNEDPVKNELSRNFNTKEAYAAIVSDLTYVRVNYKWNYICILVDLFNREIIGYSAGVHKDAQLVMEAFATVQIDLRNIQLFHTDRGREFKNQLIEEALDAFDIKRSLSMKGCPYDNAVAEATFKVFKTEFICNRNFENLVHLKEELRDYVTWFNSKRLHSSLGYQSPIDYKSKLR